MVDRTDTTVRVVVVGSVNLDQVIEVAALPRPGETVTGGPVLRLGGGKGANQAVAAARLGGAVALIGAVGSDADSAALRAELAGEGVDVGRLAEVPGPPGHAVVLVDAGAENCIVVSPGANAAVGEAEVAAAREVLGAAAVVLAQLEVPMAAVLAAARSAGGTFVLNPAPVPVSVPGGAGGLPGELWGLVDVLVPNRTELEGLSPLDGSVGSVDEPVGPVNGLPTPELRRVAWQALALPCPRVVVTLGAEGVLVRDGSFVELVPAPKVAAVDTTGAGDTFCGALAVALAEGEPLAGAARFAVRAAALSVTRTGARTAMPTRAALGSAAPGGSGGLA
ncbi:ribokinase [Kitasatospora viridis]|uniref:Ribokinase n=1 Tax=Kitasatospora viridis TaxID=281105 RepID=A0A561UCU1_9ACTN|nr:ribokinase [Kitasatospora viridis]TWF97170.1 ribokinase [Kitasatospora viridis]